MRKEMEMTRRKEVEGDDSVDGKVEGGIEDEEEGNEKVADNNDDEGNIGQTNRRFQRQQEKFILYSMTGKLPGTSTVNLLGNESLKQEEKS
jgi:hypothetical protein